MSGRYEGPGGPAGVARGGVNGTASADGAPLGSDSLRAPMPVDLGIRILRRAGVAESAYDRYSVVEGPVVALFVAHRQGAVTGAGPVDLYAGPEDFERQHLLYVFVEQRPRSQSRAVVVKPQLGQSMIFPVRHRPVRGEHGFRRHSMRHGTNAVESGRRTTLGVIFHNAR